MYSLKGKAQFECAESECLFTRYIRQGSVEAPTLWLKLARHILALVQKRSKERSMEVLIEKDGHAGYHQICSMLLADNYWIMSHSMLHLEQMMKQLVEELWRYDMEPKIGEPVVDEYVLGRRERVLSLRPLKGSAQHHSWRISQY